MDKNISNILISELHTASLYIERTFHALFDISKMSCHPHAKAICEELYLDGIRIFEDGLFLDKFAQDHREKPDSSETRVHIKNTVRMLESFIKIGFNELHSARVTVEYINLIYHHAYQLHKLCFEVTKLEIEYPRLNLIESMASASDGSEQSVAQFMLPIGTVLSFSEKSGGAISSLDWQREKKYSKLIQSGHEAIFNRNHNQALEFFRKARSTIETAESLTLIGWTYSLIGKKEKAKTYCLKAIKRDPDYGPPYNDLGTYLLSDGLIDESLKWFAMAKEAIVYQNREYPYINAGRAYLAKQELKKAMEEFNRALELAPYHKELRETVEKLKASIEREKGRKHLSKENVPFWKNFNVTNDADAPPVL